MGASLIFCLGWLWTMILPISTSWVAGITGIHTTVFNHRKELYDMIHFRKPGNSKIVSVLLFYCLSFMSIFCNLILKTQHFLFVFPAPRNLWFHCQFFLAV
jgi:hypothetical protein